MVWGNISEAKAGTFYKSRIFATGSAPGSGANVHPGAAFRRLPEVLKDRRDTTRSTSRWSDLTPTGQIDRANLMPEVAYRPIPDKKVLCKNTRKHDHLNLLWCMVVGRGFEVRNG